MLHSVLFKRFCRRKMSVVAAFILLLFFATATIGPFFCSIDPTFQDLKNRFAPMSTRHLLGTDNLGRDTFTRMVYGARISLFVSFSSVIIGSLIGVILGVSAGYIGEWVDTIISRFIDVLLAFPGLLLAIMVVAILGNGLQNTIVAISIFSIPSMARMVRGIVITLKNQEYVQASQAIGGSSIRIMLTHIIPNSVSQIIVNITLNLGTAILSASSLSFLGLGVQPPNPEWGAMLSLARDSIRTHPMGVFVPGIAITLVVMSFSLAGDGLRDALDPQLKNS